MAVPFYNPEKSDELNTDLEKINIHNPNNDTYDSDDSFPNIECDLCCKEFSSVKMYEQHLNSKKHHQMLTKRVMRQKIGKLKTQNGHTSNTQGSDILLEDDSPEEISCEICSKNFSGYIPYVTHLKSNTHSKNLKKQSLKEQMKDYPGVIEKDERSDEDDILQKPFALCTPCNKRFHDPIAFQQHIKGSLHKKKMQEKKTLESLKSQEIDDSIKINGEDEEFYSKCDLCQKGFSGPVPYKMHLHSSVHQKELKRSKIEDELKDFFTKDPENQKLICKECKKTFTDPFALKVHLENNSHEKQKAKDAVFDFVASYPEIIAVKSVQNISSDEENNDRNYQNGSYFFVCKLCHMSFSGPEGVRDHIQSKKHIQIKNEKEDRKKLLRKMKEKIEGDNYVKMSDIGDISADADASNNSAHTVDTSVQNLPNESEINDFELI